MNSSKSQWQMNTYEIQTSGHPPPDFDIDEPIPFTICEMVEPFGSVGARDMASDSDGDW